MLKPLAKALSRYETIVTEKPGPNRSSDRLNSNLIDLADRPVSLPKQYPHFPLRYPGGKRRALKAIYPWIPENEMKLLSPFLGGGSLELLCSARMSVVGADSFAPLIHFWQALISSPIGLAELVGKYYPLLQQQFYSLQRFLPELLDPLRIAAVFFVLNRASFSGSTLSGGMATNHPRFTPSAINRLRNFRVDNAKVQLADFRESILELKDDFLYLDPPYDISQGLYKFNGDHHKGFDHRALAEILHGRDRWVLSYNDCDQVRRLYEGFLIIPWKCTFGMRKDKSTPSEILIVSPDLSASKSTSSFNGRNVDQVALPYVSKEKHLLTSETRDVGTREIDPRNFSKVEIRS